MPPIGPANAPDGPPCSNFFQEHNSKTYWGGEHRVWDCSPRALLETEHGASLFSALIPNPTPRTKLFSIFMILYPTHLLHDNLQVLFYLPPVFRLCRTTPEVAKVPDEARGKHEQHHHDGRQEREGRPPRVARRGSDPLEEQGGRQRPNQDHVGASRAGPTRGTSICHLFRSPRFLFAQPAAVAGGLYFRGRAGRKGGTGPEARGGGSGQA